jgi:23S rRNA pseudouridine2605 synthase
MTLPDPEKALAPGKPLTEETAAAAIPVSAGDASTSPPEEQAAVADVVPRIRKPRRPKAEVKAATAADDADVESPVTVPVLPVAAVTPIAVLEPARQQDQGSQGDQSDEDDEEDEPDEEEDDLDRARRQAEREQRGALPPQPISFLDVVSGQFDADEEDEAVPVLKRVLLPEADAPKLHKVLAQAGLGSRLEMEQLILQGRISVNNEPAHIGQRIQFGDSVKFNGKPVRFRIAPPPARVIAYHKPVGEVVTHDDPQNRPTVFRKLPRLQQGKWQSVGRLDLNTEGLLLFTSSGDLANQLTHPRFGLEREYAVRVLGALSKEEKVKLLEGVRLDDGPARFGSIEEGGGEGSNHWYRVTISEGRNREVRRMFEAVGHAVSRLIRIRYGAMLLPRGLKRGAWMELDEADIRKLMQAAGNVEPRMQQGPRDAGDGAGRGNRNNNDRQRGGRNNSGGPRGNTRQRPEGGAGPASDSFGGAPAPRSYFTNSGGAGAGAGTPPGAGGGAGRGGRAGGRGPGGNGGNPGGGNFGGGQGQPPRRQDGGKGRDAGDRPPSGANQPDPLKTSLGYIGADSLSRQRKDQRQGPQRRGGSPGGQSGPSAPRGPRNNRGR